MRSHRPGKKKYGPANWARWLFVALLVVLTGALMLTTLSCESAIGRKDATKKAQKYIGDNFPGLSVIDFNMNNTEKEDGVWHFVFKCELNREEGGTMRDKRVTLTLFIDENTHAVWGSTADGW